MMCHLAVFALLLVLPAIPAQEVGPADCTFENGLCSLSQSTDDELDWERHQGFKKFYATLPSRDHTIGSQDGSYLAVRSPVLPLFARTARLETPVIPGGRKCLTFYYWIQTDFMADADRNTMNGLNVYVMYESMLGDPVWSIMDGDLWTRAEITIEASRDFQILFEGTVKSELEGSVAIDDIILAEGACDEDCENTFYGCCPDEVTAAAGPNFQGCRQTYAVEAAGGLDQSRFEELYVRSSDSADCDFESDLCEWLQAGDDNVDMTRVRGQARTLQNTLPVTDHTTRTGAGWYLTVQSPIEPFCTNVTSRPDACAGWYLTVQSPIEPFFAQAARLSTRLLRSWAQEEEMCLTFNYHMSEKIPGYFPESRGTSRSKYSRVNPNPHLQLSHVREDPGVLPGVSTAELTLTLTFNYHMSEKIPGYFPESRGTSRSKYSRANPNPHLQLPHVREDPGVLPGVSTAELTLTLTFNYHMSEKIPGYFPESRGTSRSKYSRTNPNPHLQLPHVREDPGVLPGVSTAELTLNPHLQLSHVREDPGVLPGVSTAELTLTLTFNYHMSEKIPGYFPEKFPGSTNALSVYVTSDSELGEPLFTSSDIMAGGSWKEVRLTIPAEGEFRIVFEALILSQYVGDISLDDVMLDAGPCEELIHPCSNARFGCCSDGRTRAKGPSGEGCKRQQTEVVPKISISDCTMKLGDRFGACWKTYRSTTAGLRKNGKGSDVLAFCAAHKTLYTCYYDTVDNLCAEDPDFLNFKAKLRDDVGGVSRNCRVGRNGVRRSRRALLSEQIARSPAELMKMLP
ncbi:MALRD1 [Branchiostoma lanceolatum]|uniref:MALRD1 protein n=1 Tax=Branchiostoma lanceolatum TaxID=7740 RepID=A0A8J9W624_BRALA|nr:MALRD1 [Branchiostoma lanceolatum]